MYGTLFEEYLVEELDMTSTRAPDFAGAMHQVVAAISRMDAKNRSIVKKATMTGLVCKLIDIEDWDKRMKKDITYRQECIL